MGRMIEIEDLNEVLKECVEMGYINEYGSVRIQNLLHRRIWELPGWSSRHWHDLTPSEHPGVDEEAICLGETGDIAILRLILRKGQPMWHPPVKCRITHWMPLPEPPEGFEPNKRI